MKAKDMMIPLRQFLKPDDTLQKAARVLRTVCRDEEKIGVKGLPVLNDDCQMIGFLSMGDILKAVFPPHMSLMNLGEFTWDGMVEDLARKAGTKKVADMMTTHVVSVHEDSPLMECVDHMLKNHIKRLPVIGKQGQVVGILYERDLFLAITKAMIGD
jgi:predicted transcriptional regulator